MYIYFFRPGLGMAVWFAKIFSRLHFCRNFRGLDFLSIGYIDPSDYWKTWFLIETFKIRLWDWETSFWSSWKEPFICQCLRCNPLISFFFLHIYTLLFVTIYFLILDELVKLIFRRFLNLPFRKVECFS